MIIGNDGNAAMSKRTALLYFHVTLAEFVPAIASEGLVPHESQEWGVTATFVEDSLDGAEAYAGAGTVTLAIDNGEFSLGYGDEIPEYMIFETVPPERLSVCFGETLVPIRQYAEARALELGRAAGSRAT